MAHRKGIQLRPVVGQFETSISSPPPLPGLSEDLSPPLPISPPPRPPPPPSHSPPSKSSSTSPQRPRQSSPRTPTSRGSKDGNEGSDDLSQRLDDRLYGSNTKTWYSYNNVIYDYPLATPQPSHYQSSIYWYPQNPIPVSNSYVSSSASGEQANQLPCSRRQRCYYSSDYPKKQSEYYRPYSDKQPNRIDTKFRSSSTDVVERYHSSSRNVPRAKRPSWNGSSQPEAVYPYQKHRNFDKNLNEIRNNNNSTDTQAKKYETQEVQIGLKWLDKMNTALERENITSKPSLNLTENRKRSRHSGSKSNDPSDRSDYKVFLYNRSSIDQNVQQAQEKHRFTANKSPPMETEREMAAKFQTQLPLNNNKIQFFLSSSTLSAISKSNSSKSKFNNSVDDVPTVLKDQPNQMAVKWPRQLQKIDTKPSDDSQIKNTENPANNESSKSESKSTETKEQSKPKPTTMLLEKLKAIHMEASKGSLSNKSENSCQQNSNSSLKNSISRNNFTVKQEQMGQEKLKNVIGSKWNLTVGPFLTSTERPSSNRSVNLEESSFAMTHFSRDTPTSNENNSSNKNSRVMDRNEKLRLISSPVSVITKDDELKIVIKRIPELRRTSNTTTTPPPKLIPAIKEGDKIDCNKWNYEDDEDDDYVVTPVVSTHKRIQTYRILSSDSEEVEDDPATWKALKNLNQDQERQHQSYAECTKSPLRYVSSSPSSTDSSLDWSNEKPIESDSRITGILVNHKTESQSLSNHQTAIIKMDIQPVIKVTKSVVDNTKTCSTDLTAADNNIPTEEISNSSFINYSEPEEGEIVDEEKFKFHKNRLLESTKVPLIVSSAQSEMSSPTDVETIGKETELPVAEDETVAQIFGHSDESNDSSSKLNVTQPEMEPIESPPQPNISIDAMIDESMSISDDSEPTWTIVLDNSSKEWMQKSTSDLSFSENNDDVVEGGDDQWENCDDHMGTNENHLEKEIETLEVNHIKEVEDKEVDVPEVEEEEKLIIDKDESTNDCDKNEDIEIDVETVTSYEYPLVIDLEDLPDNDTVTNVTISETEITEDKMEEMEIRVSQEVVIDGNAYTVVDMETASDDAMVLHIEDRKLDEPKTEFLEELLSFLDEGQSNKDEISSSTQSVVATDPEEEQLAEPPIIISSVKYCQPLLSTNQIELPPTSWQIVSKCDVPTLPPQSLSPSTASQEPTELSAMPESPKQLIDTAPQQSNLESDTAQVLIQSSPTTQQVIELSSSMPPSPKQLMDAEIQQFSFESATSQLLIQTSSTIQPLTEQSATQQLPKLQLRKAISQPSEQSLPISQPSEQSLPISQSFEPTLPISRPSVQYLPISQQSSQPMRQQSRNLLPVPPQLRKFLPVQQQSRQLSPTPQQTKQSSPVPKQSSPEPRQSSPQPRQSSPEPRQSSPALLQFSPAPLQSEQPAPRTLTPQQSIEPLPSQQLSPPPQQFRQPSPLAQHQFRQTSPTPQQLGQPPPRISSPQQTEQLAPKTSPPQQFCQPSPPPQQSRQPSPQQFYQPSPPPRQSGQSPPRIPTPQQLEQLAPKTASTQQSRQPSPTPQPPQSMLSNPSNVLPAVETSYSSRMSIYPRQCKQMPTYERNRPTLRSITRAAQQRGVSRLVEVEFSNPVPLEYQLRSKRYKRKHEVRDLPVTDDSKESLSETLRADIPDKVTVTAVNLSTSSETVVEEAQDAMEIQVPESVVQSDVQVETDDQAKAVVFKENLPNEISVVQSTHDMINNVEQSQTKTTAINFEVDHKPIENENISADEIKPQTAGNSNSVKTTLNGADIISQQSLSYQEQTTVQQLTKTVPEEVMNTNVLHQPTTVIMKPTTANSPVKKTTETELPISSVSNELKTMLEERHVKLPRVSININNRRFCEDDNKKDDVSHESAINDSDQEVLILKVCLANKPEQNQSERCSINEMQTFKHLYHQQPIDRNSEVYKHMVSKSVGNQPHYSPLVTRLIAPVHTTSTQSELSTPNLNTNLTSTPASKIYHNVANLISNAGEKRHVESKQVLCPPPNPVTRPISNASRLNLMSEAVSRLTQSKPITIPNSQISLIPINSNNSIHANPAPLNVYQPELIPISVHQNVPVSPPKISITVPRTTEASMASTGPSIYAMNIPASTAPSIYTIPIPASTAPSIYTIPIPASTAPSMYTIPVSAHQSTLRMCLQTDITTANRTTSGATVHVIDKSQQQMQPVHLSTVQLPMSSPQPSISKQPFRINPPQVKAAQQLKVANPVLNSQLPAWSPHPVEANPRAILNFLEANRQKFNARKHRIPIPAHVVPHNDNNNNNNNNIHRYITNKIMMPSAAAQHLNGRPVRIQSKVGVIPPLAHATSKTSESPVLGLNRLGDLQTDKGAVSAGVCPLDLSSQQQAAGQNNGILCHLLNHNNEANLNRQSTVTTTTVAATTLTKPQLTISVPESPTVGNNSIQTSNVDVTTSNQDKDSPQPVSNQMWQAMREYEKYFDMKQLYLHRQRQELIKAHMMQQQMHLQQQQHQLQQRQQQIQQQHQQQQQHQHQQQQQIQQQHQQQQQQQHQQQQQQQQQQLQQQQQQSNATSSPSAVITSLHPRLPMSSAAQFESTKDKTPVDVTSKPGFRPLKPIPNNLHLQMHGPPNTSVFDLEERLGGVAGPWKELENNYNKMLHHQFAEYQSRLEKGAVERQKSSLASQPPQPQPPPPNVFITTRQDYPNYMKEHHLAPSLMRRPALVSQGESPARSMMREMFVNDSGSFSASDDGKLPQSPLASELTPTGPRMLPLAPPPVSMADRCLHDPRSIFVMSDDKKSSTVSESLVSLGSYHLNAAATSTSVMPSYHHPIRSSPIMSPSHQTQLPLAMPLRMDGDALRRYHLDAQLLASVQHSKDLHETKKTPPVVSSTTSRDDPESMFRSPPLGYHPYEGVGMKSPTQLTGKTSVVMPVPYRPVPRLKSNMELPTAVATDHWTNANKNSHLMMSKDVPPRDAEGNNEVCSTSLLASNYLHMPSPYLPAPPLMCSQMWNRFN